MSLLRIRLLSLHLNTMACASLVLRQTIRKKWWVHPAWRSRKSNGAYNALVRIIFMNELLINCDWFLSFAYSRWNHYDQRIRFSLRSTSDCFLMSLKKSKRLWSLFSRRILRAGKLSPLDTGFQLLYGDFVKCYLSQMNAFLNAFLKVFSFRWQRHVNCICISHRIFYSRRRH